MRTRGGPDPSFPYLDADARFRFPPPREWRGDVVAVGGNLSPGMLLSAYEQGIFPWYGPGEPVVWQSPDPRMVIFPGDLRVSRSMRKVLDGGVFEVGFCRDFEAVIRGCAAAERPGQDGTWIDGDIIAAYGELFRLGRTVSAEAYSGGRLVGGCYGVLLGRAFFGESMFALAPNASKAAFLTLAEGLFASGVAFIDCQVPSDHLRSLGGREIPRGEFLGMLKEALIESNGDLIRRGFIPALLTRACAP